MKIKWLCGPEIYKNSGIGKYSSLFIEHLAGEYDIQPIWLKWKPESIFRILQQFLFMPFWLCGDRASIKIFYDEGWLPILLLFPLNKVIFIIHDVRNFQLTTVKQTLLQKAYFFLIQKAFGKLNSSRVVKIIAVSDFTKQSLIQWWIRAEKISVVYNAIDEEKLREKTSLSKKQLFEAYHIPNKYVNIPLVLSVGSEEERKNVMTTLQAIALIKEVIFIKIGVPIITENRIKHTNYIRTQQLAAYFIENVSDEDLKAFYQHADVFVSSSLFEWFGRTPIEAQACGCPVISSNSGWLKEVLEESALILQDPLNPKELADKIIQVTQNCNFWKNLIIEGLKNAHRFDYKVSTGKWKEILLSIQ